jgi:hypothetical protein
MDAGGRFSGGLSSKVNALGPDPSRHAELALRVANEFRSAGVEVVFVGGTALFAAGVLPAGARGVDVLGPVGIDPDKWTGLLKSVAAALGATLENRAWGIVALTGQAGDHTWSGAVLIPETGPVPPAVATAVRKAAEQTELGLGAVPAHVLAMKAVALGDCIGQGEEEGARVFEEELIQLRELLGGEVEWVQVADLLHCYPKARADQARLEIRQIFGKSLPGEPDPDVA